MRGSAVNMLVAPGWPQPGLPGPAPGLLYSRPRSWDCCRTAPWPVPSWPVFWRRLQQAPILGFDLLLSLLGDRAFLCSPNLCKACP